MLKTNEVRDRLSRMKVMRNPEWINIKKSEKEAEKYRYEGLEFDLWELEAMVQVTDMEYDKLKTYIEGRIKDSDAQVNDREFLKKLFKGHVNVEVEYNKTTDKFRITKVLDTLK